MTVIRLSDRLARLERRRAPVPRGWANAERQLLALAVERGVDVRDPEALLALIEEMIERHPDRRSARW